MKRWRKPIGVAARRAGSAALLLSLSLSGGWAATKAVPPKSQTLEAVQEVHNRMLEDLVFLRLAASRALAPAQFTRIEAAHGIVALHGTVPSDETRERALRIASWTPGVHDVRDRLWVEAGLGVPPKVLPDEVVSEQVAHTLTRDVFTDARVEEEWLFGWEVEGYYWELEVSTDDAEVSLTGTVPQFWDVRRTVEAARRSPGVRSVRSYLTPVRGAGGYPSWRYGRFGPYPPSMPYVAPHQAYGYDYYYGPYPAGSESGFPARYPYDPYYPYSWMEQPPEAREE